MLIIKQNQHEQPQVVENWASGVRKLRRLGLAASWKLQRLACMTVWATQIFRPDVIATLVDAAGVQLSSVVLHY